MNNDLKNLENKLSCCAMDTATQKTLLCTIGAAGVLLLMGIAAATVYNSKQMRAARALKRARRMMYLLGTAMRNVSGTEKI